MIVWMYVQGKDGKEFSLSILANLSDYYSLTGVFDIHLEAQYSVNNRDQWAELGVAKKYLYHEQHVEDLDVDRAPMMMSGLLVDCQSRYWKLICLQMQKFPRAHIDPSQDIIKKIIDKHISLQTYHHMTRDK